MIARRRLVSRALVLVVGLALVLDGGSRTVTAEPGSPVDLDTGRIIVKFHPGTPAANITDLHAQRGASLLQEIPSLGVQIVTIPNAQATQAVAAAYANHPLVEYAEVDAFVELADTPPPTPTDTFYASHQWQHPAVDSPEAWAVTTGDASLYVTICDTGVSNHVDLNGNVRGEYGVNTADGTTNWSPIHYHGTFVAGMVGAVVNNGIGVVGASPVVGLVPVRISNAKSGGAFFSDMAECIAYGAGEQTVAGRTLPGPSTAINLSYQTYSNGSISTTILNAAALANSVGSVLVVAAGNENTNPATGGNTDPGDILYVASTASNDTRSSFSNFGAFVDVAAPGSSVTSTYVRMKCRRTCSVDQDDLYATASGTSFAAPMVAGAVALVQAASGGTLGPQAIRDAITNGACDRGTPGEDDFYGAGLLNTHNAVHGASCGPSAVLKSITITTTSAAIPEGTSQPFTATGYFDDDTSADITSQVTWSSSAVSVATIDAAGLATGVDGDGTATITASKDAVQDSVSLTVSNVAPTADAGGPYSGTPDQPVTLNGSGADPGADVLTYEWDFDDDGQFDDATGPAPSVTFDAEDGYSVWLRVRDSDGAVSGPSQATVNITSTITVHVGALVDGGSGNNGKFWTANVIVSVHASAPAGLVVHGSWGPGAIADSCVTDGAGQCTVSRSGIRKNVGAVTFAVADITGGAPYDSSSNHVTQLTVLKS